jgi:hypothetical protein
MISPIGYTAYSIPYSGMNSNSNALSAVSRVSNITPLGQKDTINVEKAQPSDCQTCKSRKYIDGSKESDVSFKAPTHVSPQASYAAVTSHEQQHVANATAEGSKPGSELISASVSYKMSVCPECGTPFMAGGTTRTVMKYNESNPYESSRKSVEGSLFRGMNFDAVA